MRVLRGFWGFLVGLGWVAASLAFSAFSIAAVVGLAMMFKYAFPFLPVASAGLFLLLSLVIYVAVVMWIVWFVLKRKLRY